GFVTLTKAKADGSPDFHQHLRVQVAGFTGWIPHPDPDVDLTVLPCGNITEELARQGNPVFFRSIDASLILTQDELRALTPVEDVLVLGYPVGLSDTVNNMPVVRRGITATPPYLDFEGKKQFLVDAPIFHGSSGSPVFLFNRGAWFDERKGSLAFN